ncbi:MAG: GerW family sporulation protein [Rhizobium sp.]|nr:GerW family sporulation protein [Rhizobium sp.]
MESIKNMIDVNTVIGDAVETKDGTIIVPVSRVSFAFVSGGGEMSGKDNQNNDENASDTQQPPQKKPFAGGSGAGVSVQPLGFLTTSNGQLRMVPVNYNTAVDRVIDLVPNIISHLDQMTNKKNKDTKEDPNH